MWSFILVESFVFLSIDDSKLNFPLRNISRFKLSPIDSICNMLLIITESTFNFVHKVVKNKMC